jgi:alpha-1,3-rhamnosyl/mannosyltransferase
MSEAPADLLIMGRHLGNRWGGVYEVLRGLIKALDTLAEGGGRRIELLLPRADMAPSGLSRVRPVVLSRFGGSRLGWDHWTVPRYALGRRGAVLYNPGIVLPAGLSVPAIVSIHDLAYFPRPELGGQREYLAGDAWYMRRMIRRSLKMADAVHVPSQATRDEIGRVFPAALGDRVHVWPYGVDMNRWERGPEDEAVWEGLRIRGVAEPYLFYPGGLSARKNVGLLLDAFLAHRERRPELRLVLTGGAKRTMMEVGLAERLRSGEQSGSILRLGEVDVGTLKVLYQRAWALIYPSRYEGFGLPPLEAQAAGCPVVCSRATSLPEVVGPGGLYFDPESPGALLEALGRLEAPGERDRLRREGRTNAEGRGWTCIALKLLGLADELLSAALPPGR